MTHTELQFHYQKHLEKLRKEGYWEEFAKCKARHEVSKMRFSELIKPITINIPGVGDCQYTGD